MLTCRLAECVEYELNMLPRAMMCNLVNSSLQYKSFPRLNTSHAHTHTRSAQHKGILWTKKISNKICLVLTRARPNYCKTTQIFTGIGSKVKQRLLNVTADSQFCAEIAFRFSCFEVKATKKITGEFFLRIRLTYHHYFFKMHKKFNNLKISHHN